MYWPWKSSTSSESSNNKRLASNTENPKKPTEKGPKPRDRYLELKQRLGGLDPASLALGSVVTLLCAKFLKSQRRIRNAAWVTPDMLDKKWIGGVVTSVGDADGFRFYHTPGIGWRFPFRFRKVPTEKADLANNTMSLRLAGVDAPEMGHFGKPAQPYAQEAFNWLREHVEEKVVYCRPMRRDQYERIIALTMIPRWWFQPNFLTPIIGKCLSIEMLKAGYAVVYEQSGSVYGSVGKEAFESTEALARKKKIGMWKSKKILESPSEYKKRMKEEEDANTAV